MKREIDPLDVKTKLLYFLDHLQAQGEITVREMWDTEEKFTILQGWQPLYKIYTYMIIESGLYYLYKKAIRKEVASEKKSRWSRTPKIKHGGRIYHTITSLRLSREGYFPGSGTAPYLIPEPVQPYVEILEELMGDTGFSDEYDTCSNCGKVIKDSPDSYHWTPDYVTFDGELFCLNCISVDEVLERYARKQDSLPWQIELSAIREGKIVKVGPEWENGLHYGMDDDPAKVAKFLKESGIEQWWWHVEPSQFEIAFQLLLTPEDIETLAEKYDKHGDSITEVGKILEQLDVYQGYSTADEMSRALQGLPTEHVIRLETTIDMNDPAAQQAAESGKLLEYAKQKAKDEADIGKPFEILGGDNDLD